MKEFKPKDCDPNPFTNLPFFIFCIILKIIEAIMKVVLSLAQLSSLAGHAIESAAQHNAAAVADGVSRSILLLQLGPNPLPSLPYVSLQHTEHYVVGPRGSLKLRCGIDCAYDHAESAFEWCNQSTAEIMQQAPA